MDAFCRSRTSCNVTISAFFAQVLAEKITARDGCFLLTPTLQTPLPWTPSQPLCPPPPHLLEWTSSSISLVPPAPQSPMPLPPPHPALACSKSLPPEIREHSIPVTSLPLSSRRFRRGFSPVVALPSHIRMSQDCSTDSWKAHYRLKARDHSTEEWGSNFHPHPQPQNSLVRISVCNQISNGNSY